MPFVCHSYVNRMYSYVTRMLFVCQSCILVCHSYVTLMCTYINCIYLYAIRMSLVYIRMLSVSHSYVLICNGMSLVCTRMWSVCHSCVLLCHRYVTRMYLHVIRMSLVSTRMSSVCHLYVALPWTVFFECFQIFRKVGVNNNIYSFLLSWHMYQTGWNLILFLLSYFLLKMVSIINEPHCYKKIAMFHKNSQMTIINNYKTNSL